jgi:hypothetical protein
MNRRTVVMLTSVMFLGLVASGIQPSYAQSNPLIGTWKVNIAKSTYSPSPPKSATTIFEVAGQGIKVTAENVDSQGNPTKTSWTSELDGKSTPVTGSSDYDAASTLRVDTNTTIISRTKVGKLVQHAVIKVASDGKTRTVTTSGIDAKGQALSSVALYEKQ